MMVGPAVAAAERRETANPDPRPRNIADAAAQFEALLLAQMLKSMREAASAGWLGAGEDQAGATMLEVAEEHLARVLAAQGGLGLAGLIVQNLKAAAGDSIRSGKDECVSAT